MHAPFMSSAQNPPVDDARELLVVICTHDRKDLLLQTLATLDADLAGDAHGSARRCALLVVLNNCSDGSASALAALAASRPPDAAPLYWLEEARPGKSHALNAAIAASTHPLLAFVDDDQWVEAGFVAAILRGAAQFPQDTLFCGRMMPAWDGSEPAWVHAQAPYRIPIRPFPEFDLGAASLSLATDARMPSGGNLVVRRTVFDQVGAFNTTLGPTGHNLLGGEDHEFLQRAVAAGHLPRYLPDMRQLHTIDPGRMETGYTLRKSFLRSRSSAIIHNPGQALRPFMFIKLFGHLMRALFTLDGNRRFYYLVRSAASLGEMSAATTRHRPD
jgi:glycosyltransferase involved in cell wall biosynthesis